MKQQHKILSALLSCVMILTPGSNLSAALPASAAEDAGIETFPMSDVTMTDAYTVNAYEKEIAYLLSYDTERLLAGFRDNAGLPMNGVSRYDGWESLLLGGHRDLAGICESADDRRTEKTVAGKDDSAG